MPAAIAQPLGGDRTWAWRSQIGIPVRSLWVLLVYASGLARFLDTLATEAEDAAALPDVLAGLLAFVVERRLRRNLSRGYLGRKALLTRVRGRIDWLETESGLHLQRGRIACRFEELTSDTPRNRLVRAALDACASGVSDKELALRCLALARDLGRLGVGATRPTRSEMAREQIARHEAEDRVMITVAQLALDLVLPSETAGRHHTHALARDEVLLRQIFEDAVAGFYRHELDGRNGWRIRPQHPLKWSVEEATDNALAFLPGMAADIVLDSPGRRIVLDTKFTNILTSRPHSGDGFKSPHIYQLYAYLGSQSGRGDHLADLAEGLLLYPSVHFDVDEAVTIQGHRIRFATVDLASKPEDLRRRLRQVVLEPLTSPP